MTKMRLGLFVVFCLCLFVATNASAQDLIPGTGVRVDALSDDFEDPSWSYDYSTSTSSNGLWGGAMRGVPELLARVTPPSGGLSGTTGALRIQTYDNGDDAYPGQDDFGMKQYPTLPFGRKLSSRESASLVTHVYMPDPSDFLDLYDDNAYTFGVRLEVDSATTGEVVAYSSVWFYGDDDDMGISIRSAGPDRNLGVVENTGPGWWTIGMSFEYDEARGRSQIGFYASPGVDDLTDADKLHEVSLAGEIELDYNFFSLGSPDTGTEISAQFIVDDVSLYIVPEPATMSFLGLGGLALFYRKRKAV